MSSSCVFVQAADGLLYKDPILHGDGWFACFGSDDPPEVVVVRSKGDKEAHLRRTAAARLLGAGIEAGRLRTNDLKSGRSFPPAWKPEPAASFHFELLGPIPIPQSYGGVRLSPAKMDCPCHIFWHDFDARTILETATGASANALLADALLKRGHYQYADAGRQLARELHKLLPWTVGATPEDIEERLLRAPPKTRIHWKK